MAASSSALVWPSRWALGLTICLLLLHLVWQGAILLPVSGPALSVAVFCAPLIVSIVLLARRWRGALTLSALIALLYFCHGAMLIWAAPADRLFAGIEVLITLAHIGLVSVWGWRGLTQTRQRQQHTPTDSRVDRS